VHGHIIHDEIEHENEDDEEKDGPYDKGDVLSKFMCLVYPTCGLQQRDRM
jgi:hypothetical protein